MLSIFEGHVVLCMLFKVYRCMESVRISLQLDGRWTRVNINSGKYTCNDLVEVNVRCTCIMYL